MEYGANLIYKGCANHQCGLEFVGGWLYLYPDKLIFKSHELNCQEHVTVLHMNDIKSIVKFSSLFIIPNGLKIISKDGSIDRFIVYHRSEWIELINKQLIELPKSSPSTFENIDTPILEVIAENEEKYDINLYKETGTLQDTEDITKNNENIKIALETCTKSDLLTIDGFDEEKANRFISEHMEGKKYYDLETTYYGLKHKKVLSDKIKSSNLEYAVADLTHTIQLNPDDKVILTQTQETIARNYYNNALELFENGSCEEAIVEIDKAVKIFPDNKEYIDLYDAIFSKANEVMAEKLYQEAVSYINSEKYRLARNKIESAINLIPNKKIYIDLLDKIKIKTEKKKEAQELQQAKNLYKKGLRELECAKLEDALADLTRAVQLDFNNNDYKTALAQVQKIMANKEAKEYFNKTLAILEKKKEGTLKNARYYIKKAYELSNNKNYYSLLKFIEDLISTNFNFSTGCIKVWDVNSKDEFLIGVSTNSQINEDEYKGPKTLVESYLQQAEGLYKTALDKIKDGNFKEAIADLKQAIQLNPNNNDYKTTLTQAQEAMVKQESGIDNKKLNNKESEVKTKEETMIVSEDEPISIETCTKKAILTIDGFDEEKADRFISERMEGKRYYDIESFAEDFELQPHQMIALQDKLIFPLKPKAKKGRMVDI